MTRVPAIGERFELPEEQIFVYVDSIQENDDGEPAALVIAMDDGRWAAVRIADIEWRPATVR